MSRPGGGAGLTSLVCASACGLVALATVGYLGAGAPSWSVRLALGLPGAGATLAIDALSGVFLLIVAIAGAAASWSGRCPAFHPAFLAGMAITLLAGDAWTLLFGLELMSLSAWALVLTHHREAATRAAAGLYLGMTLFAGACLVPAFALLAPHSGFTSGGFAFAQMRAAPPEGWRALAVLVLVLLGAGSKAGLAPLHVWLPPAHAAAPAAVSALMSGAMTKVALYVLIRVLFDLCGPVQPVWWGLPLLAAGAASAVLGALRANMEADMKAVLAASTIEHVGFIAIGLGVALSARAADLPPLAALALGAALLHALNHGVFKTLLFLCAGAVQDQAGTRMLHRLGGLIHRMPVTTACVLVGAAALAALPPAAGFASEWLLLQSVLGVLRVGGLAFQTLATVVAALMALAAALAACACVRLVGVAFLGRPRIPRASAADEAAPRPRAAMLGLALLCLLLGAFPGLVLRLIDPALGLLVGAGMADRAGALVIGPQADGTGYAPLGVLLLLALSGGLAVWAVRRWSVGGERRGPAWACGFAAPPAWLPFGDPATQYGAASFAEPLQRSLGAALLGATEAVTMPAPGEDAPAGVTVHAADPALALLFDPLGRLRDRLSGWADGLQFLTIRRSLSVMFAALVLLLAVVAWLEAA